MYAFILRSFAVIACSRSLIISNGVISRLTNSLRSSVMDLVFRLMVSIWSVYLL